MQRKTLVNIHVLASVLAMLIIFSFFFSSLSVELLGDFNDIKKVKRGIVTALPVLLLVMPVLAISGNRLARRSMSLVVVSKQRRMKWVMVHGLILTSLAVFLFYRSHFGELDQSYHLAQVMELCLGFTNLMLLVRNFSDGRKLSTQP